MNFENTKEIKHIFESMHELVMNILPEEKRIKEALNVQEDIQKDLLHEIELANLNAIEITKVYCQLRKMRQERRKLKDTLDLIYTIKQYTNEFVKKGILSEISNVIKKVDTYEEHIKTRIYVPRVLENLKCAKKK